MVVEGANRLIDPWERERGGAKRHRAVPWTKVEPDDATPGHSKVSF